MRRVAWWNATQKGRVVVLYHARCPDGFGAALVAWFAFREEAKYIPVAYGEKLPEIADGAVVYIVDFSYSRAVLAELAARMVGVMVIDHHKTAEAELASAWADKPENLHLIFDMGKSGAVLAWDHFYGDVQDTPLLLAYVQDRDLWRWRMPHSRAVSAGLALLPRDFKAWAQYLNNVEPLKQKGWIVLEATNRAVKGICSSWFEVRLGGHGVPCVNTASYHSECCEELARMFPEAPFVACYVDTGAGRKWSLRSGPDFDVGALAKSFGGGGHAQAAGFMAPLPAVVEVAFRELMGVAS